MSVYCRAQLNYFHRGLPAPVEVEISDGCASGPFSWQEHGFELRRHRSAVDDWRAIGGPGSLHYEEIGALARELTGCDAVLYYPALLRDPQAAATSEDLAPVMFVHSDYTEGYRAMLADGDHPYRHILAPFMEAAGVSGRDLEGCRRIVTLQFWRNIGPPRMDRPLAFCDARSVSRSALTPVPVPTYGGLRTEFESFAVAPPSGPAEHRWTTFPEMTADEVVVFRSYDSERADAGEPFWTPHSAFVDPTVPADAPPRESLEMRAVGLFLR